MISLKPISKFIKFLCVGDYSVLFMFYANVYVFVCVCVCVCALGERDRDPISDSPGGFPYDVDKI